MKLTINKDGAVLLDDKEIDRVTRVDIKNIDPLEGMDVAIHVHVTRGGCAMGSQGMRGCRPTLKMAGQIKKPGTGRAERSWGWEQKELSLLKC